MKNAFFIVAVLLMHLPFMLEAQQPADTSQPFKIKVWKLDDLGGRERVEMDTSLFDSHDFNPANGQINLGHLGAPMKYQVFGKRQQTAFLFFTPFDPLLRTPDNTRYVNTRYPFTFIKYTIGGQQDTEAMLEARHSQNVNENLNFGTHIDLRASKKFYENERSLKSRYLNFFGSYVTEPYTAHFSLNINKVEMNELGGIQNKANFEEQAQRFIPGRLEKAKNILKDKSFHLFQTLSLKKTSLSRLNFFDRIDRQTIPPGERDSLEQGKQASRPDSLGGGIPSKVRDSLQQDDVPRDSAGLRQKADTALPNSPSGQATVTPKDSLNPGQVDRLPDSTAPAVPSADTIAPTREEKSKSAAPTDSLDQKSQTRFYLYHHLGLATNSKRYSDKNPLSGFYSPYPIYIDSTRTNDQAGQQSVRNELKLIYSNKFARLSAGMDYELVKYSYLSPDQQTEPDYDLYRERNYNNLALNSSLSLHVDTSFSFDANVQYFLAGFQGGDLYLKGTLKKSLWNSTLTVKGHYKRYEPDYFYQYYHSNHFSWNQPLAKIRDIGAEGRLHIPSWKTTFSLKPYLIRNHTYLDTSAHPVQYQGELQVTQASVKKEFQWWKLHSTNKAVLQYTNKPEILGLPSMYFYHELAFRNTFHFQVTGGNLHTQLGWSLYYYPGYHMDDYMPALNLFHRQEEETVGNRPLLNLFLDIQIKRTRIYVKLYHLSSYLQPRDYYTAPRYPMSPMMVKFGFSWSFYD